MADVSGANLDETLDGIVSKTDAMDLLEKLIIRWNLLVDQILIVSPFLGTQWTSKTKRLEIWQWLSSMLDASKSIFLTRAKTWTDYKAAMEASGEPVHELERFGLENKIVAMDMKKHDFHVDFNTWTEAKHNDTPRSGCPAYSACSSGLSTKSARNELLIAPSS